MTRYYLDTEFIDNGKKIHLISIGIVSEDGRELYLQSVEFNEDKASAWVKENVIAHLALCPCCGHKCNHEDVGKCRSQRCMWRTREQIANEIRGFLDITKYGAPEIWGWCSAYDFVAFCQLFGTMMHLPLHYPHYFRDLQYILDERRIRDDALPEAEGTTHNALDDAKHIKQIMEWLHV